MKKEHKRCLKRIAAAALVMLMVSGTVPFQPIAEVFDTAITASAAEITSSGTFGNGGSWTLDSDGKLTVKGTGSISVNDFKSNKSIKSVVIENGITTIGGSVFCGCSSLTSVTIPNSVRFIGSNAFEDCSSLTTFTIPNSITSIYTATFKGCSSLTSVTIPNSITSIGNDAFNGCSSLTSVDIPNSVESIGIRAFHSCTGLTSISIPSSVKEIGQEAFINDVKITDVYLYAAPENLAWNPLWYKDFITDPSKGTKCHVYMKDLPTCVNKFNAVNATFVGDLGFVKTDAKDATCTTAGNIEYYTDPQDGKYYKKISDTTYEEITEGQTVVAAGVHDWGEVSYTWSNDNSTVTATRTCKNDATHVETGTVYTTSAVTKDPTCVDKGETTYTATFTNTAFETQTKTIETGNATGHTYGEPTWNWNGTESATATFVCEKNDDTQNVAAVITSATTKQPTYTEVGTIVYTATAEFNGKTYTDTKNVDVEMLKRTDISSAKITLSANSFDYDESEKTVTYTVKVGDKVLTEGTDFTFEGDTTAENAGVYIIKVKGVDDYEGTAQTTWKIVPPEVTVKINSQPITQAYSYNNSLTVTAPKAESGKKFSHWEVDGNKVSYSETYSFIVKESVDLIPVYVDDETAVEQQAVLNLKTSQTTYNSKKAIEYTFTHSIPNGYTVKEVGLLYATNKLAGADTTKSGYATMNLTTSESATALGVADVESAVKNNTSGKVKKYVASYKNLNGTVTFSYALGDNTTAYTYAVGYVKVVKNGVEETLYTNFVATDYNSANN